MIDQNDLNKLPTFYEDISKISSILLRKEITTKEIYIILFAAKLINKDFNLSDIAFFMEHLENMFTYLQNNKFSNKDDFSRWEKQMLTKIQTKTNNQEERI